MLPLEDNGDGSYTVHYTLLNVSHLQDVEGQVKVLHGLANGNRLESQVHGRPPLLSDPKHDMPTCQVVNVAAAGAGGSVAAAAQQLSYYVRESINGVLEGTTDGWGYSPQSVSYDRRIEVVFTFSEAFYVNKLTILSGLGRTNHMLTGFKIFVTTDAAPTTPPSYCAGTSWTASSPGGTAASPNPHTILTSASSHPRRHPQHEILSGTRYMHGRQLAARAWDPIWRRCPRRVGGSNNRRAEVYRPTRAHGRVQPDPVSLRKQSAVALSGRASWTPGWLVDTSKEQGATFLSAAACLFVVAF